MDDTELGTQKIQDFQTLLVQNLEDFERISWNTGQNSKNLGEIHGILVGLTENLLQDLC